MQLASGSTGYVEKTFLWNQPRTPHKKVVYWNRAMPMEKLRERMSEIEGSGHSSYAKHSLVDILLIVMCGVLSRLEALGDLVIYAKRRKLFMRRRTKSLCFRKC